jgi:hypothetical protein
LKRLESSSALVRCELRMAALLADSRWLSDNVT